MMPMRIAIVGVSGLIGSAVASALTERGDDVLGVVRTSSASATGWTEAVWNPSSAAAPDGLFVGCDAVVNVTGAPIATRWTDGAWASIVASRVYATEHVGAAVVRDGVPALVNASAVGYYGSTETAVDETSPAGSGALADLCVRWENAARECAPSARVVLLRTGVVLDRDGGALARMLTPARLGLAGPIGGGRQWFPWVHIADAVGLILQMIDGTHSGPVNLVAPGIVRQRDFVAALGRVLHRPAVLPTPAFVLKAMLGEGAQVVTRGQNVVPKVALEDGYAFTFPTVDGALADLVGD